MTLVCEEVDLPNEPDLVEALLDAGPTSSPKFARAKGLCRECGAPKHERRSLAEFCSDRCRAAFHNRSKIEGAAIIHVAKRWRRYRNGKDLTLLYRMLSASVEADKAAGRDYYPDPPASAHAVVVGRNVQGRRGRR